MVENIDGKRFFVSGMTCNGCEAKIERKLKTIDGIINVKASYASGKVSVSYDKSKIKPKKIKQAINRLDYQVMDEPTNSKPDQKVDWFQIAITAIIILGVFVLMNRLGGFDFFNYFPEAKEGMSYAAVFAIGLLTSIHCIGMCGGINLSQCMRTDEKRKGEGIRPSFLYNSGRVLSYTAVGGVVGALGSVISFNGVMRGAVALVAGILVIIMGLNMLNLFPWLRWLQIRLPKFLTGRIEGKSNSPLYVGFLNGLMPCGPLQAMQLYALSTGSWIKGAFSMFLFALGTTPLMFSFGAVSSLLSKKFTSKMMMVSAVLVIILGVGMFNTGINMSGFLAIGTQKSDTSRFEPVIVDGYQMVEIEVAPRSYAPITVKKDIPVKFIIHAESKNLNGCNNAIIIPQYGIQKSLDPGDNVVEFTPTETGVIPYSCWMNMIRSSITVVD